MPTLTIKGLPDPDYRRLKANAEAHRRSLNGEIIACLERAVAVESFDPSAWLVDVAAFRREFPGPAMTDAAIRAAKRKGRACTSPWLVRSA